MPVCKNCGSEIEKPETGTAWIDQSGSDICQDSETSWHEVAISAKGATA